MRKMVFIVVAAAALPLFGSSAQAREYPWCAVYGRWGDIRNCGFENFGQCQATISGVGGSCQPNPWYRPQQRPRRRH